jgi:DNA (cytosine-5)-methyltransferase 1
MLTVGSLFSGIGGLDLGLERAGMKVIWQSEIDPYCNKVLKKHWPEVTNHGNIKNIDWGTIERPDVICGGYPCQPFSTAGKRRGTDDPRHLWPWVKDAISALRPSYAILENVRGHLSMGGLQVIGELAEIGYDAEWRVVSAAGMGAPHRRDRIIIVAYPTQLFCNGSDNYSRVSMEPQKVSEFGNSGRSQRMANANDSGDGTPERRTDSNKSQEIKRRDNIAQFGFSGCSTDVADTNCGRQQECDSHKRCVSVFSQVSSGEFYSQWQTEPNVGRVADGISSRVDRLRGLGNAVVPQVAEYIGHLVMAAHNNT